MALWTQRRALSSIPFQGSVQSIGIDRDGVLGMIAVRLGYTITNGGSAAVGPKWNALARLIRNLKLQIEGQDTLIEQSGEMLAAAHVFEFGCRAPGMDASVVLTANAATAYNIRLLVPFFLPRARRPDDTSIDLRPYKNVSLTVNWGTIADIYTTPNGAAISNVVCQPEAYWLMDEAPRLKPEDKPYLARVLDTIDLPISQSSSRLPIKVDAGRGILHRGFHVVALVDDVANNALLDGGDIELGSAGRAWVKREAIAIRQDAQSDFGLVPSEVAALAGQYRIDLSHYGQGMTFINADSLTADLQMFVGASLQSGVNKLLVRRETIRPIRA